jgi:hypothetical protein
MHRKSVIALLVLMASLPLFSEVVPSATQGGGVPQWTVGTGFSYFSPDYGPWHLAGGTLWINDSLNRMPSFLSGLSLDIEARDLSLFNSSHDPVTRIDTAAGGAIYKLSRYRNFRPYGKVTVGLGNIDYMPSGTHRYNQSRTVTGMGGGCDIRAFRSVWVRADYEFQYWPNFWVTKQSNYRTGAAIDPNGLTIGAVYHFGHDRRVY